jgi:YHS domain-containing protein
MHAMDELERDPVCGMSVDPRRSQLAFEHGGRRYLFCSAGCLDRFRTSPGSFLSTPSVPARESHPASDAARSTKGLYTCPMHPEVRQAGPGACPKCGMALEPTASAADGEAGALGLCAASRRGGPTAPSSSPRWPCTSRRALDLPSRRRTLVGSALLGAVVLGPVWPPPRAQLGSCRPQPEHVHADRSRRGRGAGTSVAAALAPDLFPWRSWARLAGRPLFRVGRGHP